MKRIINTTLAGALVIALGLLFSSEAVAQDKGPVKAQRGAMFVDQDGDGICDNLGTRSGQNAGFQNRLNGMKGKGYGPGDGTGYHGNGPKDGTGFGPGAGSANCDGTGPKGRRMGAR